MRILLVEDNELLSDVILCALSRRHYFVDATRSGEEAWFLCYSQQYDCVILDLNLPDLDGLSVLERLRDEKILTPIIILTVRGAWEDKVKAINLGADDYLSKPFRMEELLARINAVVRRSRGHASSVISANGIELNLQIGTVVANGNVIELAPLELRALSHLMQNRGIAVPSHELIDHIYGPNSDRNSNALEALIRRLRKKLKNPLIRTRRGVGYLIDREAPEPI